MMFKPLLILFCALAPMVAAQSLPISPRASAPPVKRALPLEEEAPAAPPPPVKRALPLEEIPAVPALPVTPIVPPPPAPVSPAPVPPAPVPSPKPSAETPEVQPIQPEPPVPDDDTDIPIKPAAPKVAKNAKPKGEDAVRLQVFLDDAKFGPGVIDGKPGRFTELAVRSWNEVNGRPLDDWTAVLAAARKAVPKPFAVVVVPDWVEKQINPDVPYTDRKAQAKLKAMSYRSVEELVAERYHCDVDYLTVLNNSRKINNLKAGDSVIVPNVNVFRIEDIDGTAYPADDALSQRHVVVDTRINQLRVFEAAPVALMVADPATTARMMAGSKEAPAPVVPNRGLIASFPITPGKPQFIKLGTWEIRDCVELPVWRYDQQLLDTGKRSDDALIIPPGPNSPVGVIWNGTSRSGIGLHGTSNPETIGRARSAGCIRLANWDAIRLPTLIRPGATVEIR